MGITQSLFFYVGYFIILLIAAALAIIFARSNASWVLLGIGSAIQLLALSQTEDTAAWLIFAILVGGTVALILQRRKAPPKPDPTQGYMANDQYKPVDLQPGAPAPQGHWRCACGRANPDYATSCVCGINKRERFDK